VPMCSFLSRRRWCSFELRIRSMHMRALASIRLIGSPLSRHFFARWYARKRACTHHAGCRRQSEPSTDTVKHAFRRTPTRARTHARTHARMYARTHTRTHARTHARRHAETPTQTHTTQTATRVYTRMTTAPG
jgi:hypothetical protein